MEEDIVCFRQEDLDGSRIPSLFSWLLLFLYFLKEMKRSVKKISSFLCNFFLVNNPVIFYLHQQPRDSKQTIIMKKKEDIQREFRSFVDYKILDY